MDDLLRDRVLDLAGASHRARTPGDRRAVADRLWDLLDDIEAWPSVSCVGADGEEAAWEVAQSARDDPALVRRCLEYIEVAVALGDAPAWHEACLLDRALMNVGRPQRYGTQVVLGADGRELVAWPIDDPGAVDRRRAGVGLPPLAEHLARLGARA